MLARLFGRLRKAFNKAFAHELDEPLSLLGEEELSVEQSFSPEAREVLEREGYLIYNLEGLSIHSLRLLGFKIGTLSREGYLGENFWIGISSASRLREVAFHPEKLFLPRSNIKSLYEQRIMIHEFSQRFRRRNRTRGVRAIMGQAGDYTELAFQHFKRTGERLFEEGYARSRTEGSANRSVCIGCFSERIGLLVNLCSVFDREYYIWAAPLIVPIKT